MTKESPDAAEAAEAAEESGDEKTSQTKKPILKSKGKKSQCMTDHSSTK